MRPICQSFLANHKSVNTARRQTGRGKYGTCKVHRSCQEDSIIPGTICKASKFAAMGKPYCLRCARTFRSVHALQQHYNDSFSHHRCDVCGTDEPTWEKLLQHHRKTGHRVVCQGCDDGDGMTWIPGSQEYQDHLRECNVCTTCEEHFQSPGNLENHKIAHLQRTIKCYGCDRKFPTYPSMIIHLESGACPSEIDYIDLNESAALCYQWKAFLDEDYRDDLLDRYDLDLQYAETVYPFECPGCDSYFRRLSALFQHVYSTACNQDLQSGKIGKLVRWLERRHDASGSE
ncbi:uncharacterized protein PV09_08607 [Verruconis gallopava]|uniref:C2H2-type domain-containing protein n=1 Tax=Verruconis gallopava TaxID=253628 RepID=A0A0D2AL61_9PEZI|nr:uncharacterized protein PV09_08607 [Verruconis gallopava]KIV99803.1 hypothetical protein PV09_08607 [Verruconis gallopava]